jgi:hypothetical protein
MNVALKTSNTFVRHPIVTLRPRVGAVCQKKETQGPSENEGNREKIHKLN